MRRAVFRTDFAPPEEIEGVKEALDRANIRYQEFANSRLWLGGGSLCVSDPDDYDRARSVIDEFQARWREQARRNPVTGPIAWRWAGPLLVLLALFVLLSLISVIG